MAIKLPVRVPLKTRYGRKWFAASTGSDIVRLKKTLLAVSISAAANASFALDVVLDSQGYQAPFDIRESLNISGSFQGEMPGVWLRGTSLRGDMVNTANIGTKSVWADGETTSLLFSGDSGIESSATSPTYIMGSVTNSGRLQAEGLMARAIALLNTKIDGVFTNTAELVAVDSTNRSSSGQPLRGASAIEVSSSELAELVNTGLAQAFGTDAKGVYVRDSSIFRFRNQRSEQYKPGIVAEGFGATGLYLDSGANIDQLENATRIHALDDSDSGQLGGVPRAMVVGDGAKIGRLYNMASGRIVGESAGSIGLHVNGGVIDSIVNEGDISGWDTGILVSKHGDGHQPLAVTLLRGVISGVGKAAIDGGGQASLDWLGGMIDGNLLNMKEVVVGGDADFQGRLISAGHVGVVNGGNLTLSRPHTDIDGDFELFGGGVLSMSLFQNTDPEKGILNVSGRAILSENAKIVLNVNAVDFQNDVRVIVLFRPAT